MLDSFFSAELIPTWNFVATKLSLRKWFRNEYMKGGFVHSHNVTGKDFVKDLQIASTRIGKGRKFWHSFEKRRDSWRFSKLIEFWVIFWSIFGESWRTTIDPYFTAASFYKKASNHSAFDVPLLGRNVMPFYRQISIKINSLLWVISLRSLSASATKNLSPSNEDPEQQHSLSEEVY